MNRNPNVLSSDLNIRHWKRITAGTVGCQLVVKYCSLKEILRWWSWSCWGKNDVDWSEGFFEDEDVFEKDGWEFYKKVRSVKLVGDWAIL